ncbi:hypothetical protein SAMN05661091_2961 [Paenibacillus uliginis N3/975]|uniref:Uncharacterized protein n=1 Tax=Paenibacillus uliginis N3/975 TaxID=1313296 RepID=A0A1X7HFV1_9BACL|nr:hypothetical protein SAMN05661091_2961 [Paenibacillus uliginis N3/975]
MQELRHPHLERSEFYIVTVEEPKIGDIFSSQNGFWEIKIISSTGLLYRSSNSPYQSMGEAVRKRCLTNVDDSPYQKGKTPFN